MAECSDVMRALPHVMRQQGLRTGIIVGLLALAIINTLQLSGIIPTEWNEWNKSLCVVGVCLEYAIVSYFLKTFYDAAKDHAVLIGRIENRLFNLLEDVPAEKEAAVMNALETLLRNRETFLDTQIGGIEVEAAIAKLRGERRTGHSFRVHVFTVIQPINLELESRFADVIRGALQ